MSLLRRWGASARAVPISGENRTQSCRMIKVRFTVLLVKRPQAPVVLLASSSQLVLYLLNVSSISCSECGFARDDSVQHFDESVTWNVHQFCRHRVPPSSDERNR